MAVYSIELPDKRVLDIEANDEATAIRGAQEWFQSQGQQAASTEKPSFLSRAVDMFTGSSRNELPDRPEFLQAYMNESAGAGEVNPDAVMRSAVTPDQNAQLDILEKQIPGLEHQFDKHGNLMLKAPGMSDFAYLNAPGVSGRDLDEFGTQTLATLPILGGVVGKGATTLGRAATSAAGLGGASVTQDAMAIAQGSEQGVDPLRAGLSAGLGAVTAPGVPTAIAKGVKKVGEVVASPFRGLFNAEGEAARRVANAVTTDAKIARGLTPAQTSQALARDDLMVMDTGGEMTKSLARKVANVSPEAREKLNQAIDDRFVTQAPRATEFLQGLISTPGKAFRTREELQQAARTARAPFYQKAYKDGSVGITDPLLDQLQQAPALQDAMKTASRMLQNRMASGRTTSAVGPNGPTLEFWDLTKRALDDKISSLKKSGERAAAADLDEIRVQLVNRLDQIVPSYKEARGVASSFFKANDALEAGENFVTQKFENDAARKALAKMSPAEQEMFREGFISRTIQQINETPDRRTIVNQLMRSPAERERMGIALGQNKANEFETFVRIENLLDDIRRAVQGNSTTARQLWDIALFGAGSGLGGVAAYTNDPYALLGAAIMAGGRYGKVKIEQRVANKIADMLVSKDPSVVQKAIKQIAHTPILNAVRKLDEVLEKAGIGRGIAVQQGVNQGLELK